MSRLLCVLRALLLPLLLLPAGLAVAASDLPAPHQVIEKATSDLLARITSERPKFKQNPEYLYTLIDQNLAPYVDFDRIARRVMAKYYAQATADQRARFGKAFRDSLIRAYGAALADYNDQKVSVLKPGKGDVEPARASVNMDITLRDGGVYRVQYQMFLDASGAWKLENLILEGINLGLTYRNNFAEMYGQYGGNIDQVIANWSSRVAAEKKKSSSGKRS